MKTPPLLPEETLRRVLRVANMEGLSVLAIAGMFALASASMGDYQGTAIGLLAAASGAIELHGAALLQAGAARGTKWLIVSQPYLMAIILAYCAWRLSYVDPQYIAGLKTAAHSMYGDGIRDRIAETGLTEPQYYALVYRLTFTAFALATLIYQGLMTLYYLRRRPALIAAAEPHEDSSD